MVTLSDVTQYITENILHSKLFDLSSPETKQKAVNQAINTLDKYMSDVYRGRDGIPVEDVADQVLWLLKMDDSIQRAEMGTLSISVDGMQIQLKDMERIIAPNLMALYGKESIKKKKVGSYMGSEFVHDSYRMGNQHPPSKYRRY
jgi:DNA integrity scanning protein DisA with diadenylate cyclase activity